MNHTNIVLIPKVETPESIFQFYLISVCNFAYEFFSKLMANRLKAYLPGLISHHQSAFVPGHQIQDNIFVAHEAFHFLKH